jgi:hypothetical protein
MAKRPGEQRRHDGRTDRPRSRRPRGIRPPGGGRRSNSPGPDPARSRPGRRYPVRNLPAHLRLASPAGSGSESSGRAGSAGKREMTLISAPISASRPVGPVRRAGSVASGRDGAGRGEAGPATSSARSSALEAMPVAAQISGSAAVGPRATAAPTVGTVGSRATPAAAAGRPAGGRPTEPRTAGPARCWTWRGRAGMPAASAALAEGVRAGWAVKRRIALFVDACTIRRREPE